MNALQATVAQIPKQHRTLAGLIAAAKDLGCTALVTYLDGKREEFALQRQRYAGQPKEARPCVAE